MLGKLVRKLSRTARGVAPLRHQLVFYDLRISGIEAQWKYLRLGYVFSEFKSTWCAVPARSQGSSSACRASRARGPPPTR